MQPLDADGEAGPRAEDQKNDPNEPDQQSRAGEAEQIVDVHSAEPDQAAGDENGPDNHVDQDREPVFAAVDPAVEAEKQRCPIHRCPL
jgi:hypothetical protein